MTTEFIYEQLAIQKADDEKMRLLAPLREWLREKAALADKSSQEWRGEGMQYLHEVDAKTCILNPQASYRAGEWFAYRNVLNYLTGANYL